METASNTVQQETHHSKLQPGQQLTTMPLIPGTTSKPRVILGLMTFGPDAQAGARITSLEDYKSCLRTLQAAGYDEIDTARIYVGGAQEAFTAAAGYADMGFSIATKCYPRAPQTHKPDALRASLEKSLAELGTACVDIFYLHAADRSTPFEETLAEAEKMHKEGKFVRLGLSNFTAFEVAEVVLLCRQHGWVRPTIYQGMYNATTRNIEPELIPCLRRYGLDLVVYNPLAGGLFSGKYSATGADGLPAPPETGRFSDSVGAMGGMYRARYFRSSTFRALAVVEEAVARHAGLTMVETALRWLLHHSALRFAAHGQTAPGANDGIIIGVSSEEQLKANIKALEGGPLPDDVVKALDEAWLISKAESANYWHLDLKYTYDTKEALFGNKG